MATILGFLNAIVEMFGLIRQAIELYQQAKKEGWIDEGRELASKIKNAKTDDERRQLVKDLLKHQG